MDQELLDFANSLFPEPARSNDSVSQFVAEAGPLAERVGQRLGVDPAVLLGQWGLETGWGKSVVPGTNNYGNIKDFSGGGVAATDNMTGSRDKYRAYQSPDAFGDDFAGLIERRYRGATNAGSDAQRFASALKSGGYAEDPDYVNKLVSAADMVRGTAQPVSSVNPDWQRRVQANRQAASDAAPFSTSFKRGMASMQDALANVPDVVAGDEQSIVQRLEEARQRDLEMPMPTSAQGFLDYWRDGNYAAALLNPMGMAAAMTEQLPNSIPSMVGSVPGMVAGGVAGSSLGPMGTLLGSAIGGFIGSAPGSVALEMGARITEMAARDGVDLANPQAMAGWLSENRDMILEEGFAKGLTVAGMDGIAGGIGMRIVAGPAMKLRNAEAQVLARLGATDDATIKAAQASAPYKAAMAPALEEFKAATTVAQNAMRGAASFVSETVGEGAGEYYGEVAARGEGDLNEALLEALMAGGQSAITTGAQALGSRMLKRPENIPNSPLTNAANAGQNVQDEQPAPVQPSEPTEPELSPFDQRLQAAQSMVEDKAFIQAVRGTEGLGPESVTEVLSAFAKARNPNLDERIRERALTDLEGFIETFANRPNFVLRQDEEGGPLVQTNETIGDQGQAPPQLPNTPIDGEVITRELPAPDDYREAFKSLAMDFSQEPADENSRPQTLTTQQIRDAIFQGERLDGRSITINGIQRTLQGPQLAAARKAEKDAQTRNDQVLPGVSENPVLSSTQYALAKNPGIQTDAAPAGSAEIADHAAEIKSIEPASSPDVQLPEITGAVPGQPAVAQTPDATPDNASVVETRLSLLGEQAEPILSAFPDIPAAEGGLIPINRFSDKEAQALQDAGIVESAETESGDTYQGVDAENLWPLRQALAEHLHKNRQGVSDAERNAGVERRAQVYDRLAQEQEDLGDLGNQEQAVEYRAKAADIRRRKVINEAPDVTPTVPDAQTETKAQQAPTAQAPASVEGAREGVQGDTQAGVRAYSKAQADRYALVLSNHGLPSESVPHPTEQGKYAVVPAGTVQPTKGDSNVQEEGRREALLDEPAAIKSDLDAAAHEAATSPLNDRKEPTDKQKDAGNFKVGRVRIFGMEVSIEHPKGSIRSGIDKDGNRWERRMAAHYGYFTNTKARDGDNLDVYLGDDAENAKTVFVIDQIKADGTFDEHKTIIGPDTEADARALYLAHYPDDWTGLGAITSMPVEAFKAWATDGKKKRKALAYVAPTLGQQNNEPASVETTLPAPDSASVDALDATQERPQANEDTAAVQESLTSESVATGFEQLKTSLKILGDPDTLKQWAKERGIAVIPRKDGVSVPNKKHWDAARKQIPMTVEKRRVDGVPDRLADVTLETYEDGSVKLIGPSEITSGESADAVLARYAKNYANERYQDEAAPTIDDVAERIADDTTAAHVEDGEAQKATPAVVAESVQKSADETPLDIKAAKAYLLSEIDKAIKVAPSERPRKEKMDAADRFVTFDVPGDGKFKVLNTVERLKKFRSTVNASPGFSKPRQATKAPSRFNPEVSQSRFSVREMLDDGDLISAYEYAKSLNKPLLFGRHSGNEEPIVYVDAEIADLPDGVEAMVGRRWLNGKTGNWAVIELSTGRSLTSDDKKEAAVRAARDALEDTDKRDRLLKKLKETQEKEPYSQDRLADDWLKWAEEEQARIYQRKQDQYNGDRPESAKMADEDSAEARRVAPTEAVQPAEQAVPVVEDGGKEDAESSGSAAADNVPIPDGYKKVTEYFRDNKPTDGYAPFAEGERVKLKVGGQVGTVASFIGEGPAFPAARVEFDNGTSARVEWKDIESAVVAEEVDYKGFERTPRGNGDFDLRDGNLTVSVEAMGDGRYQASFRGSKSSPHLQGEQGAVDWADAYRGESERAQEKARADVSSVAGQKALAERGSRIASLKAMNAQLREIDPAEAWADSNIEDAKDLDALQDSISQSLVSAQRRGEKKQDDELRKRLENSSSDELKAVFGAMSLAGSRMSHAERVEALLQEDQEAVVSALDDVEVDGRPTGAEQPSSQSAQGIESDISADKKQPASVVKESLTTESDTITPDAAVKQMEWRDGGQRDGERRHTLFFKESEGDKNGFSVATLRKYGKGKWVLDDADMNGDIESFDGLREAKKAGQDRALKYLEREGYVAAQEAANDRDTFTMERVRDGKLVNHIFARGDRVKVYMRGQGESAEYADGQIEGISHAQRKAKVDGVWTDFSAIYPAEREAETAAGTFTSLSEAVDAVNAKNADGLTDADRILTLKTFDDIVEKMRDGDLALQAYQDGFSAFLNSQDSIRADLEAKKKDDLLRMGGRMFAYRMKSEKKDRIIASLMENMRDEFALGQPFGPTSYVLSAGALQKYEADKLQGLKDLVDGTTEDDLKAYADRIAESRAEYKARVESYKKSITNPETLDDFRTLMSKLVDDGMTRNEAYRSLTPDQRLTFDKLDAESTRATREASKPTVQATAKTVAGEIVETKHTRDGYDLFVVKPEERVERDTYNAWNATAKRLGGWYSKFRGNGAVPGFQFKTRENAEAFLKFIGGDAETAQEAVQARKDAFEDDKSQSAVERLRDMAGRLDDRASESLSADRKVNTARRARMAAGAEASANADKALAKTMANLADAIENGKAQFLDRVRQKVQVEMLSTMLASAKREELSDKYQSYADQQKHDGPATVETVDYVRFPEYTAFRSDLARLGREFVDHDGAKKLGERLLRVANDVTDAYLEFAKENFSKVAAFSKTGGEIAGFKSRDVAERAIARSGYRGKAIVLPLKRGENVIILSPTEAQERGIWNGDPDKKITLNPEFAEEVVQKARELNRVTRTVDLPWIFETAFDRRRRLADMNIRTGPELRSALREFVSLKSDAAKPDRVKELERAMVGRQNDGMDFFPTPAHIADEMVEAAGIEDGMSVLEPSAGMGHIAERIRAAGVDPDVVEASGSRRELLEAKGFNVVGQDFMDHESADGYDRIVMNPPFSNRRDAEHVRHAYTLLRPGGRLVAIMGEGVFFGKDAKAQAFRDWLEEVGGTSEKLPEGTFNDPTLPVNTGVNARMVVIEKGTELYSRAIDNTNFRTKVFTALAQFDEFFEQPTPSSKSLKDIAHEIDAGFRVEKKNKIFAQHKTKGKAVEAWEIFPRGQDVRSAYVFEDARGRVWLDVSRLKPGVDHGTKVYGIVAGYAHNNGKVFIGDPAGLSESGFHRRLESMISSALKYGTTDHLYPHAAQTDPAGYFQDQPEVAKRLNGLGIDWKEGDFAHNLTAMLEASYNATVRHTPAVKNIIYDFEARQFVDAESGARRSRGELASLPRWDAGGTPDSSRGGSRTYARAAIYNALVRGRSAEARRNILAQLGDQLQGRGLDLELGRLSYSLADPSRRRFLIASAAALATNPQASVAKEPSASDLTSSLSHEVEAVLREGGASAVADALNLIAKNGPESLRALAKKVADLVPSGVRVKVNDTAQAGHHGKLTIGRNGITLELFSAGDLTGLTHETFIHEALHAGIGSRYLSLQKEATRQRGGIGDTGSLAAATSIGRLRKLWTEFKGVAGRMSPDADSGTRIAVSEAYESMDEFFVRALTDPEFQKFLADIPYQDTSLLAKFFEWIRRLLGLQKSETWLDVALRASDDVLTYAKDDAPVVGGLQATLYSRATPIADAIANLNTTDGHVGIMDRLKRPFETHRTFNWWERTVGSQYGKAKKSPEFGKVFHKAKSFIADVSRFANRAADQARSILPHMDTWGDITEHANLLKQWSQAKGYREIADAVFTGTLEGVTFTDVQLEDRFGLNEQQRRLYHEFRAAVNVSLDDLAASELARSARAAKLDIADQQMSLDDALDYYVGQLEPGIEAARDAIDDIRLRHEQENESTIELDETYDIEAVKAAQKIREDRQKAEIADAEKAVEDLEAFRDTFTGKVEKIRELQDEGYAPLMRFGQYTVDVVRMKDGKVVMNEDGEPDRPFFGMFESEAEANENARILAEEYPGYTVSQGILSLKSAEMYRGLTPETAEMFARMLGTTEEDAFQAYLKQAVANRSAMKRLIKRKGMEGFSKDVPRVLAAFLTSNARLASGNWHFGEMSEAINEIPQSNGDVKDEAIRLAQYIQNPQEEAAGLRGFMFFTFLGGSVASAMVNMTQTFTTTLPYLSQFAGKKTGTIITDAMKDAGKVMFRKGGIDGIDDAELKSALKKASEEGIVDPQEIHLLMAESGGGGNIAGRIGAGIEKFAKKRFNKDLTLRTPAERAGRAFTQAWGSLFGFAEKYNRHVAFIAAWRSAPDGVDRYQFAVDAVDETQFVYNKSNRPNWGRGVIGATVFTFRTFIINYLEFLARLPRKQQALALGVLVFMAGFSGIPGLDDLDDAIDATAQKLGYNWNSKLVRHSWLVKTLGNDATNFIERGISAALPLDVSARLSVANLVPGTGAFKQSNTNRTRDVAEVVGPVGSIVSGAFEVFDSLGGGKGFMETIRPVAPKALNDLARAVDIWQTGHYRDSRGRNVAEADAIDGFVKLFGFHPNSVAEPRRVEFMLAQSNAMVRGVRSDIHELMARGRFEGDPEKVKIANEMLRDWNRKNPDSRIKLNPSSIAARVKAMRSSSADRLVKATPRDLRDAVKAEIAVE